MNLTPNRARASVSNSDVSYSLLCCIEDLDKLLSYAMPILQRQGLFTECSICDKPAGQESRLVFSHDEMADGEVADCHFLLICRDCENKLKSCKLPRNLDESLIELSKAMGHIIRIPDDMAGRVNLIELVRMAAVEYVLGITSSPVVMQMLNVDRCPTPDRLGFLFSNDTDDVETIRRSLVFFSWNNNDPLFAHGQEAMDALAICEAEKQDNATVHSVFGSLWGASIEVDDKKESG